MLIVVLIICIGLVSLTLVLGHSMVMAYRGSDNEIAGRQADVAIDGAVQYAETLMKNVTQPGAMPDPNYYQYNAVPLGDATFWFIGEPDPTDTSNEPAFGLVDEASKLNINTASATMLENLPGMTQDLAEAIVSWRTSGTSSSTTSSATASTATGGKGAPFETVEELAQVNGGTDMETLYGTDTNLNHVLDPSESGTGATAYSAGLLEYVTVFSRQPNVMASGTTRINVTVTSGSLTALLNTTFGSSRGGQIAASIRRAGRIRSVLEFYMKSGMTAAEFGQISPQLSMSNAPYSVGLINVNTASDTVLECVPGITQNMAEQILTTRLNQDPPVTDLSWVAPILGAQAAVQAGPYLTAETYQVSADVAAVGAHGRGYRRALFVIDNSTGTPQIVYRRNLSYMGWALGSAARQTLAQAAATP